MNTTTLEILQWGTPVIGTVIGWFAGRHGRKSDSLMKMQETIDLLVEKNQELTEQLVQIKNDNAMLKVQQTELKMENEELKKQVEKIQYNYARKNKK